MWPFSKTPPPPPPPPPPLPYPPQPHSCETHGHRYVTRNDSLIDPRLDKLQVQSLSMLDSLPYVTLYVRDICTFCGDVIDRVEGMHPLEMLAHQAK